MGIWACSARQGVQETILYMKSQPYIPKRRTLIQVIPLCKFSDGEIYSGVELTSWTFQWDLTECLMHEQTTKGFDKMNIYISRFGVRIGWRKYLNKFTPFGYVSLWNADRIHEYIRWDIYVVYGVPFVSKRFPRGGDELKDFGPLPRPIFLTQTALHR